ncbi:Ig-like domain-containing protein [Fusibacter ferrireducens]|uniref:Ig-like domain-containing protein n=1 Tax=Fusibacter ferrireducens TaxID=2785058 RepID=A0ABR9ZWB2_9FIRM|nr:Ig-like domain-containing protein [Fusibacter ferrireducens]MBF4694742.1 Ig-like domain-containing protein [Fusibacter ferrireducens]
MKNLFKRLGVLLLAVVLVIPNLNFTYAATATLGPEADTAYDNFSFYGPDKDIYFGDYMDTGIRFNLSNISGTVSEAKLKLYISYFSTAINFNLYKGSDNWLEASGMPTKGDLLIEDIAVTGTGWIELDVTSFISAEANGDGKASFFLSKGTTNYEDLLGISSKEAGSNASQLLITYTTDSTPPTLTTKSPVDGATNVGVNDNLVLTFSEVVNVGTGNIVIKKSSDDSTVESIDVTSGLVTGDGTDTITVNPSVTFTEGIGYYVQIDATAFDDTSGNSYAGINDKTSWNFTTEDVTAPTISTLSPTDGGTNVGVNDNLVITFSEVVNVGTGNIIIKKASDDSTVESINVTSGMVTGDGTDTITVNPSADLAGYTGYYVQIDGTAFDDTSGNSYAGINNTSDWNFTTESQASSVTTQAVSSITETSATGNGTITGLGAPNPTAYGVCWNTTGTPTTANSKTDEGSVSATGAFTTSITGLSANTTYYARAYVINANGTSYGSQVSFSTDVTAPTLSTSSPADGATNVGVSDNLVLTFSEAVNVGTGNIVIKKSSDDSTVETIDVTSGKVTGDGTNTITVNPSTTLAGETGYYVQIDATAFDDVVDNGYAGINDTTSWNFTTEDITAPTLSTLSPTDGASNVGVNDNLVLTFSEAVNVGTGNVVIKKASDDSTVESIDVTSGLVTGDGTNTITVNPSVTLAGETGYYVQIDATAFDDTSDNSYAGINDKTSWNFTTEDVTAPTISTLSPTDGGTNVGVNDNLVITFSEVVNVGTGNIIIKKASDNSTVESINVTSGMVTGDGTDTITVNPSADLAGYTGYYVQIDGTAFDDTSGNSYAGISNTSDWNFTTETQASAVTTQAVSSITETSATGNGTITGLGAPNPTAYGVCWNTTGTPTTANSKTDEGSVSATGAFTTSITGLSANTTYYARAYVINANGTSYGSQVSFSTDVTAPTLSTLSPADGASNVGVSDNLVLTFSEVVNVGTGNIVIKKSSDDSTVETIDVTGVQVSGDGTNTITVNPSTTLAGETGYYVQIDASAFDDTVGNSYVGINDATSWNFTTEDITAPTLSSLSPVDGASNVGVSDNLVLTFTEAVNVGTGNVVIKKASDDSTVESIDVTGVQVTGDGTNTITVNPSVTLTGETGYYVQIDATAFDDTSGNSYAGINDTTSWNFITEDITAPTLSTLSPTDGGTNVGVNDNLVITFSEAVNVGTGNIVIKKSSDDSTVETIDVTGVQVSGDGTNTITVNPSVTLTGEIGYYVQIDGTAFDDTSGNSYAGISDTTSWNFTTADVTAPTLNTKSPADGANNVGVNDNLVLTFSELVNVGTGNIVIKKSSDNSTVETIDVTSGQVTGDGTNTITVNPSITLAGETGYYVQIDTTAFDDTSGNSYAGINDTTSWNFATEDITAPTLSTLSPTDGGTNVGVNDNLVITFSEAVNVGTGNIVIKKSSDDSTVETIDVTGVQVSGDGTNTITVNPSTTLAGETGYYVQIDATAFDDTSGNSYAGINDTTSWNFTTEDITAPTISTLSPTDGGTNVGVNDNLMFTFSEAVNVGTGNIVIRKSSDDSTVETIDVTGVQVSGDSTNTITVNPSVTLSGETGYYVQIDATAFDDTSGNSYAGINDTTSWNFTTADVTAPTLNTKSPADGASNVGVNDNLVLTFSEVVNVGTGNIVIKKSSDDSTVESIDVTGVQVSGDGTNTITVNPSITLAGETGYYVQIDATAFDDTSGNSYAGINDTTSWNFTTEDITAPTLSTLSPADGASNVSVNDNLVLTFSEAVNVDTGNIIIKKSSDNTTVESIDVTGTLVTGGGTNTITVNPSVTLIGETGYYVQIDGTAFADAADNHFVGIGDTTSWNFTTIPSDNALLAGIDLNTGTLSPAFASGTQKYTVNVSNSTTSVTLKPTISEAHATLAVTKVVGTSTSSVSVTSAGSVEITPLTYGNNSVNIAVTAQDGTTLKNYVIDINRALSGDMTLSDLSSDVGVWSPSFASEVEYYTVEVPNATTSVHLIPIVNESHAVVTAIKGVVTSGSALTVTMDSSIAVDGLAVGNNAVNVIVTAQDGVSTKTYYVNIKRAASSEVALSNLTVDHGTLSPAFAPDTEHYAVNVSNTITAVTLTPTVSESHSTIKVKRVTSEGSIPVSVTSGSSVIVNALEVGKNSVMITVTAQDEHTTKTYTIDINRAGSSDVTLSDLAVNVGTLTPAFTPEHESYSVKVPNSTTSITLTPITNESHASISINGINRTSGSSIEITPLIEGENSVAIVVTAQDGQSTKTYNLTVIREAYVDNSKDDKPDATPSTDPGTVVGNEQDTVTIVINGKEQSAGKEVKTVTDGKTTVTVAVNNQVIESKIDEAIRDNTAQTGNTIQVPISDTESQVAKVELTGDIVKKLEQNTFDISVKRSNIEYVIPAREFTISKVAESMGVQEQSLVDIKIEVKIAKVDEAVIAQYNEVVANNGSEMVFPPTEFEIVAKTTGNDGITKEVTIGKFSNYVERVMEIPANVDPAKVTTGIVFNSDGTYSHVPTDVFQKDGKWYTRLNSLTNSRYTVIYNPVTVKSVANHWSKAVVNDMASRLIVINPETFEPEQAITRADFSEYLVRALGLYREGTTSTSRYSDVTNANARALGIYIASENGIVSGYPDGTFKPNQQITREEAMVMYRNAMKLTNLTGDDSGRYSTFKDFTEVSGWASESVRDVLSAHIFNGTEPLMISPKSNLKYSEAIQAIRNLLVESNLINR